MQDYCGVDSLQDTQGTIGSHSHPQKHASLSCPELNQSPHGASPARLLRNSGGGCGDWIPTINEAGYRLATTQLPPATVGNQAVAAPHYL